MEYLHVNLLCFQSVEISVLMSDKQRINAQLYRDMSALVVAVMKCPKYTGIFRVPIGVKMIRYENDRLQQWHLEILILRIPKIFESRQGTLTKLIF